MFGLPGGLPYIYDVKKIKVMIKNSTLKIKKLQEASYSYWGDQINPSYWGKNTSLDPL